MDDQVARLADLPETDTTAEAGDLVGLVAGQPEQVGRGVDGVLRLAVNHPRLRVRQQSACESTLLGGGITGSEQVGQAVHHEHVRHAVLAGELEAGAQPSRRAEVRQQTPRLVEDDEPPASTGANDRGVEPGRGAGHEDGDALVVGELRQVDDHERAVPVDVDRRAPVEHAAQVAVAQPAQLEGDIMRSASQVGRPTYGSRTRLRRSARGAPRPPRAASGSSCQPSSGQARSGTRFARSA